MPRTRMMRLALASSLAPALALVSAACGGSPPPPAPPPAAVHAEGAAAEPPVAAREEGEVEEAAVSAVTEPGSHAFSSQERSSSASLLSLVFAQGLAIRPHPSGDVVILGSAVAPNEMLTGFAEGETILFVARVEPEQGAVRWVLRLNPSGSQCSPGLSGSHLEVDAAGRTFVAFHAMSKPYGRPTGRSAEGRGPVLLGLDADGGLLFEARLSSFPGDLPEEGHVAGLAADGAGGAHLLLQHPSGPVLVHLGAEGQRGSSVPFTPAPVPYAGCRTRYQGRYVIADSMRRSPDGSLLVYGYFGEELQIGGAQIRAASGRQRPDSFWARFEADGRLRSLRRSGHIIERWIPLEGEEVLVVDHTPAHQRQVRRIDLANGHLGPILWRGESGIGSLHRVGGRILLRLQQGGPPDRSYGGVTVHTSSACPTSTASIVGEPIGGGRLAPGPQVIYGRALGGRTTQFGSVAVADLTELPGGRIAAVGAFRGRIEAHGMRAEYRQRLVPCHPGPVGEEVSLPAGCTEPIDEMALFLSTWTP